MSFPPNLAIRPLNIGDLSQVVSLEMKGFPEDQRASEEKLNYRLTVCPELCSGLFIREFEARYNKSNGVDNDEGDMEEDELTDELPDKSTITKETLIGHIIATKCHEEYITSESMEVPELTDDNLAVAGSIQGHIEASRYIGIHSLIIDPEWQKKNFATLLLHDYIQKLSNQDCGDKIILLCKKELIPFYNRNGFSDVGVSQCKFAGLEWHDMAIDLIPEENDE